MSERDDLRYLYRAAALMGLASRYGLVSDEEALTIAAGAITYAEAMLKLEERPCE